MNKRNMGTRLFALLLAAALALALAGCKKAAPAAEPTAAPTAAADKVLTLHVTFPDGTEKDYTLATGEKTLSAALLGEGLIAGRVEQYGLFIETVDGVTADESAGEYWIFTKGGEWVTTGADDTPIADGDAFEFFIYQ